MNTTEDKNPRGYVDDNGEFHEPEEPPLLELGRGNLLLFVCALFYIAWWVVFFRPGQPVQSGGLLSSYGVVSIAIAGITGVLGLVDIIHADYLLGGKDVTASCYAAGAGILVYAILLVTTSMFGRQVTTELFLITALSMIEGLALHASNVRNDSDDEDTGTNGDNPNDAITTDRAGDSIPGRYVTGLTFALVIVIIVSLVCYMQYYKLSPWAGFIVGIVPLALFGLYAIAVCFIAKKTLKSSLTRHQFRTRENTGSKQENASERA